MFKETDRKFDKTVQEMRAMSRETDLKFKETDHIEQMNKLHAWADENKDTRKFIGAIAGPAFTEGVKKYALKAGFYVLQESGDTVEIIQGTGSWQPKMW